MNKIFKLYRNEITKASRRVFFIIVAIAMFVSVIGMGGIYKIIDTLENSYYLDDSDEDSGLSEYESEWIDEEIEYYEEAYGNDSKYFTLEQTLMNVDGLLYDAEYLERNKAAKELGDYSIVSSYYSYDSDYKTECAKTYIMLRAYKTAEATVLEISGKTLKEFYAYCEEINQKMLELDANEEAASDEFLEEYNTVLDGYYENIESSHLAYCIYQYSDLLEYEDDYAEVLKNSDYPKYVEIQKEITENNETLTEEEKSSQIETYDLLLAAYSEDLTDTQWAEIRTQMIALSDVKTKLENTEYTFDSTVSDLKAQVAEIELGLSENAVGYGAKQTASKLTYAKSSADAGIKISQIFMIIIGAMLVADEIASGAIKSLIIAPVRRHKIFTAKLLLLFTAAALSFAIIFLSFILTNTIYGFSTGKIVFTFMGSARVIGYFGYFAVYIACGVLKSLVFGLFALLLSTLLRSTGGAMSISLVVCLVVDGLVSTICTLAAEEPMLQKILVMLPTTNLDLASAIFVQKANTTESIIALLLGSTTTASGNFLFSLGYIIVLSALMIFTSYQSFIKRDIK